MSELREHVRENAFRAGRRAARGAVWVVGAVACGVLLVVAILGKVSGSRAWPESLTSGSASAYSVLIISLDTTRADHLGCYGSKVAETPALDRIAERGILFDDAVTVAPITLPAHASILTGLVPPNHGVHHNGAFQLDDEHTTLAEVLHDHGYQTAAFLSAFVLDSRFGLDQGFDTYDDNIRIDVRRTTAAGHGIYERSAGETTDVAIQWLTGRDRDRPFFAWVHYFDPHQPVYVRKEFKKRFGDRAYDAEIAYMDTQIGRLVAALEKTGDMDRTVVVVVGDHGEGLEEHEENTHAMLIYDSVMRVPLLLSCPGVFRGGVVVRDVVVSVTDVFPTVLDLLGIDPPGTIDGQSLLTARSDVDRAVFMESLPPYLDYGWAPLYGLRRHDDKYILAPTPEYYDLRSDPDELSNLFTNATGSLAQQRDAAGQQLMELLSRWPTVGRVAAAIQPVNTETLKALQALGYVGTVAEVDEDTELADPKDMMPVWRAINRAAELLDDGHYDQALSLLEDAQTQSPNIPRVLLLMGKLYLHMGRTADARAIMESAMATSGASDIAIFAAQAMMDAGQPAQAAEILEQVRHSRSRDAGLLINLGVAYLHGGRVDEALDALLEAEQLDQSSLEIYINLAACHRHLGNPETALSYIDKAIELAPETVQAHLTRALILKVMRKNEQALEALTIANRLDARNPGIVQELGNVCMRLGRHDEAVGHFQTLGRLLPNRWEPHLGLGRLYLTLGRLDEAVSEVRAGLRLAPNEPRIRALAARVAELQRP